MSQLKRELQQVKKNGIFYEKRQQDNSRLMRQIKAIHTDSDAVYGSPRIWEELRYQGETCRLNRVARLVKSADIVGIPASKQWRKRTSSKRPEHVINHLDRDFTSLSPDIKWVTVAYVHTGEGWLYLAVIIDIFTQSHWLVDESTNGETACEPSGVNDTLAKTTDGLCYPTFRLRFAIYES